MTPGMIVVFGNAFVIEDEDDSNADEADADTGSAGTVPGEYVNVESNAATTVTKKWNVLQKLYPALRPPKDPTFSNDAMLCLLKEVASQKEQIEGLKAQLSSIESLLQNRKM